MQIIDLHLIVKRRRVSQGFELNMKSPIFIVVVLTTFGLLQQVLATIGQCECNTLLIRDGNTKKVFGDCLEPDKTGKYFCYVNPDSGCTDERKSRRGSGLLWSYKACDAIEEFCK